MVLYVLHSTAAFKTEIHMHSGFQAPKLGCFTLVERIHIRSKKAPFLPKIGSNEPNNCSFAVILHICHNKC